MTDHGGVWVFLEDQGSFIAGFLALIAAGIAYVAGQKQARATREAAEQQVAAIHEQIRESRESADREYNTLREQIDGARQEAANRDRSERRSLIYALGIESARLHRLARDRRDVAQLKYGSALEQPVLREIDPYLIDAGQILTSPSVLLLGDSPLSRAALDLNSKVDILNSALSAAASVSELRGAALLGHLQNVITAAETLAVSRMRQSATLHERR